MSSFRTILPDFDPPFKVNHGQEILCIGSCFARHIAQKLVFYKLNCKVNPFGILYHPMNIYNVLDMSLESYMFSDKDLIERDGYWYSWWHHSEVYTQNKILHLKKLQEIQTRLLEQIKNSKLFIFTFGTAFFYNHIASEFLVGNCHKIASSEFEKRMSNPSEISEAFIKLIEKIQSINKDAQFIFTVSPVRHIKDGIIENTRSKANLQLAIAETTKQVDRATYFPAYEIMMDDLRDYRFYEPDLLHPNEVAINYIWDKFTQHLFSERSKQLLSQIEKIQNAVAHRAFQPKSQQHQSFVKSTLDRIEEITKANADLNLNFSEEKKQLNAVLA